MLKSHALPIALFLTVLAALVWSGVAPHDRLTWWLEVSPALIGLVVLATIYRWFRFTPLASVLIALHMLLLIVGGHYTYALVPIGEWFRDAFHLTRNHYDRLGHFIQGFVPAILAREVFRRQHVIASRKWCAFLVVCFCLAVSALYELFECAVALVSGAASDAFLGTQGDPWDTQEDMALALVGAITALVLLGRWHDAQLSALEREQTEPLKAR